MFRLFLVLPWISLLGTNLGAAETQPNPSANEYEQNMRVRVVDMDGQDLPRVEVSLKRLDAAVDLRQTTDAEGKVLFESLGEGVYEVSAELDGFLGTSVGPIHLERGFLLLGEIVVFLNLAPLHESLVN